MKPTLLIVNDYRDVPSGILGSWVKTVDPRGNYEVKLINSLGSRSTKLSPIGRRKRADAIFVDVRLASAVITLGSLASQIVAEVRGDYFNLPHPAKPVGFEFRQKLNVVAEQLEFLYNVFREAKQDVARLDGKTYYT